MMTTGSGGQDAVSGLNDESGLIYGLEFQCRSLCAVEAETEKNQFLVGTQSLKMQNQVKEMRGQGQSGLLMNIFLV